MRSRKTFSMRLEAFDAEELGANGHFQVRNDGASGRNVLIECRMTSRLRKNHFGTAEIRWPARMGQEENPPLCQTCEPSRFSLASQVFLQPVKSDQSATERPRPREATLDHCWGSIPSSCRMGSRGRCCPYTSSIEGCIWHRTKDSITGHVLT